LYCEVVVRRNTRELQRSKAPNGDCRALCAAINTFLQVRDESARRELLSAIAEQMNDASQLNRVLGCGNAEPRNSAPGYRKNGVRERLLRVADVETAIGLKRSWIYREIKNQAFPEPVKIGHASAWRESAIEQWINERDCSSSQMI
jgi:predicted DNA-binding transcriptional regulator AlpA